MDGLPPPDGSPDSLIPADEERAVAIYGATNPDWTQRVTAEQFLAAHPTLAARLRSGHGAPPTSAAGWIQRFTLPLAVLILILGLLLARDWKLAHLFFRPTAGDDPARTLDIRPLAQSAPPPASAPFIRELNVALTTSPLNWSVVLEKAEACAAIPLL
jgi:hypothetical protein